MGAAPDARAHSENPSSETDSTRTGGHASLSVALGLAAGPAVGLGLARFGYGLILPPMRAALHWDYSVAGALNTANAAGYLAGSVGVVGLRRRFSDRTLFLVGIVGTVCSLAASAWGSAVVVALALRALSGIFPAVSLVAGAALLAEATRGAPQGRSAVLLGVYFGGGGLGVAASGLLIPAVLDASGTDGWRFAWATCAALGALLLLCALPAVRALKGSAGQGDAWRRPAGAPWPVRSIGPILAAYGLYGVGYITYMTFIVALLQERGAGPGDVTVFWVLLGLAAVGGGSPGARYWAASPAATDWPSSSCSASWAR